MPLKIGDAIKRMGKTIVIKIILEQDVWHDVYDVEFIGTDGKYHHWKSNLDGGEIIRCK